MSGAGIVRAPRRPAGWVAPGPAPAGAQGRPELQPAADEDLCFLCGDWRLFQKQRGHRWSLDDLVTAWVATRGLADADRAAPRRALDLGCGLGSVLLMVAWTLPRAEVVGIEAQLDRAAMGRRAIAYNGCADRCQILDGDLRDDHAALGAFDLITGTPPYFPPGTGTTSQHTHAEACRFEVRGGVEDYLAAAARHLAPGGTFTVCTAALERTRLPPAAAAAGLALAHHLDVVPRAGKDVLVCVDQSRRADDAGAPTVAMETLTVRQRDGSWTPAFQAVRAAFGMPTTPPRA
jgi:tRNA1Val (adenine37-N6)-methyltransferase